MLLRAREVIFGTVMNCVGVAVRPNQYFCLGLCHKVEGIWV
jgi:hypothetical protein